MPRTTLSPGFRLVIPKNIRAELSLVAGQAFQVLVTQGFIHLVPEQPLSTLRGIAKGMEIEGFREK